MLRKMGEQKPPSQILMTNLAYISVDDLVYFSIFNLANQMII